MATNNAVNTGLSGSTGSGSFVGSTAPTISQPNLVGTTTNNNAAAGSVGQYASSVIPLASAVSMSTNTALDLTSISLTAGDWDLYGNVGFNPSLVLTYVFGWMSLSSATLPDVSLINGITTTFSSGGFQSLEVPFLRVSIPTTTNIYISAQCGFASGTCTIMGGIFARRVR